MEFLRTVSLFAATMTMGLMAGVFGLYTHTIMPGFRQTDDRTFVGAFQSTDRAIINPWFLVSYLGALVFTGLAAAVHLGSGSRSVLPWAVAALVFYLATFIITFAVNVPLNNAIKAAGHPDEIRDLNSVRTRFNEGRWSAWNLARTLLTTVAFGCLIWAMHVA